MKLRKNSLNEIDIRCIFVGYVGCPNCHCENCQVFHDNKFQTPVNHYYRFWFAYMQMAGELPIGISRRRLQTKSKAVADKEKRSRKYIIKMNKSDAKKLDWKMGKYDGVRGKFRHRFGG